MGKVSQPTMRLARQQAAILQRIASQTVKNYKCAEAAATTK